MSSEILVPIFLGLGLFFIGVGCLGLYRMPDIFCRMHATSKATTLGLVFILMATFVHLGFASVGLKAVLAIIFAFLTAPVGAHLISRAAYQRGAKLHDRTIADELRALYPENVQNGQLKDLD
ncbi:MAG: monovalent cation/H(+) antiporter subunit G [Nitrospira sp.]|nr:monovalent cation/H(+) antiporter subunit G [Candidatus Manganitrophaceae bacterium]HIL34246.1 monovalent cation/H(+) antiporter subunit G [Candidatus Manganitrophaceae bacterium]